MKNNIILCEIRPKKFDLENQYKVVVKGIKNDEDTDDGTGVYITDKYYGESSFNLILPILNDIYKNYIIGKEKATKLYEMTHDDDVDEYLKTLGYNDSERHTLIEFCQLYELLPYYYAGLKMDKIVDLEIEKIEEDGKVYEVILK